MYEAANPPVNRGSQALKIPRAPLAVSTLVSSLGGFLFGYDTMVISGAIGHLARYFALQPAAIGWAAGCALIGCLMGSACSGGLADRFGLKKALYACAACFVLSSIGVWLSSSFTEFVAWRIVGGVGIGAASIVAPMYIAEIAPAAIRGRLVVFYQFGIVTGILAAVFVNLLIERAGSEAWNVVRGWRWMFAAGAIPAFLFALAILFAKESPRWLMKKGRRVEADKVLSITHGRAAAARESMAIRQSLEQEEGRLSELFTGPFRRSLIVGFILAALTQMSGITALLSFLPEVFKEAGEKSADAFFQSVLVGVVNLAFTAIALWLVDKAGRKTLILCGTALQTVALGSIAWLYLTKESAFAILIAIMAFVAGHAIGNGAACWVILSEIFPTKVRGAAMSISTTAIWIFAYLANQFFPLLQRHWGNSGAFLLFAGMAAINFVFVLLAVPETKGYSLEAIGGIWTKREAAARVTP